MPRTQDDPTDGDSTSNSELEPNAHRPIRTDGGESEDNLTKSSQRLGDRFSRSEPADQEDTEDTASTQQNGQAGDGTASEATGDTDAESESEPEWKPATLYLTGDTRKEFNRFLMRIQLEHPEIEEVNKRDIHEGVLLAAMERPDEVAAIVEQNTSS